MKKLREARWYDYAVMAVWFMLPIAQWQLFATQQAPPSFLIPLAIVWSATVIKFALTPPDLDISGISLRRQIAPILTFAVLAIILWFAPRTGSGTVVLGLITDILAFASLIAIKVILYRRHLNTRA